jgi:predicted RNase H-like HicB family nuclease
MKTQYFPVVITQDEDGMYMARVAVLPGCHTQAKSLPVLYTRIEEAIGLCLEVQKKKKKRIVEDRFIGVQQIPVTI